jgi:recombination protein RecA
MAKRRRVIDEEYGEDSDSDQITDKIVKDLKNSLGDVAYILGRGDAPPEVSEWISTGSTELDAKIANNPDVDGGIPVGRLTEIFGEEATGKSFIAYMALADCQRRGGIPVLIDTENSANMTFLKMLGLDPEDGKLIYIQVDTIEEVFTAIESVIVKIREEYKDKLCVIVWDSVAATTTKAELQNDYGDVTVALGPRLIGQGLRKIGRFIGKERIALIFLNQVRMKIGIAFGNPFTTPGGKAIPFTASVRVQLLTAGKLKAGDDIIGVNIKAKVVKNRMGPPHRECVLQMYFDKGIVDEGSWIKTLTEGKIVKKLTTQKSSIVYEGETYEFNTKKLAEFLEDHKEIREYCKKEMKKYLFVEQDPAKRDEEVVIEALVEGEEF